MIGAEIMEDYSRQRKEFLQRIEETLSADVRFVAAWLTGSLAKNQGDALSDIDITLVLADDAAEKLCAHPWQVSAQTTADRYGLFSSFGQPALLHENNHNAPEGGTFTFVAYAQSVIMVDWILRPLAGAGRPADSLLLWDKAGIPIQQPPAPDSRETRASQAAEITAFFWMMAAITVKYIYRGDGVFVNTWLEELHKLTNEVERRIAGQAWQYKRGSFTVLSATRGEQIRAIRQLCDRMEKLMPELVQMGGHLPASPRATVDLLIDLVNRC